MNSNKKTARIVGVLFIIGTVAGVSTLKAGSILNDPNYLTEIALNENQILTGSILILVMGFALSMMSVILYPVLRKFNQTLALGSVVFRGVLEAVMYIAISMNWLLQITISREYTKAETLNASYYQVIGNFLRDVNYWSDHMLAIVFTLGALMIYYVFYKSKLVPRWLSGWGFIGAILYLSAALLNIFDQRHLLLTLEEGNGVLMWPLAIQEMVFALWLIVKGFNSSAIVSQPKK
ncbi:DUF4386 domain-containing protein [Patescibacteria group bacterium]